MLAWSRWVSGICAAAAAPSALDTPGTTSTAMPAARQASAETVEVRDAVGNLLSDGDQVTLIKDLQVNYK